MGSEEQIKTSEVTIETIHACVAYVVRKVTLNNAKLYKPELTDINDFNNIRDRIISGTMIDNINQRIK